MIERRSRPTAEGPLRGRFGPFTTPSADDPLFTAIERERHEQSVDFVWRKVLAPAIGRNHPTGPTLGVVSRRIYVRFAPIKVIPQRGSTARKRPYGPADRRQGVFFGN